MKLLPLIKLLVIISLRLTAQQGVSNGPSLITFKPLSVPALYTNGPYYPQYVFANITDSIEFYRIDKILIESQSLISTLERDSLLHLRNKYMYEKAIRIRRIYRGSPGFQLLQELDESSLGNAKKISVFKATIFPENLLKCFSLDEIEFVQCSFRKMPKDFEKLRVNAIRFYDSNIVNHLKFRKNEEIKRVMLRGFTQQTFPKKLKKLMNLDFLDLSSNDLLSFPKQTLKTKSIKTLLLANCKIQLKESSFKKNKSISKLDLTNNQIKYLPSSINKLPALTSLLFANNQIEKIGNGIGNLKELKELSFYKNNLKSLPDGIYNLTSLSEIDLYYNQLTEISDKIGNWKELKILYLAFNKMLRVPLQISNLSNLEELYLHSNRLVLWPDGLDSLKSLKVLRINNNHRTNISLNLVKLPQLENLDLSSNGLTVLPENFWTPKSLKLISLSENPWSIESWSDIQSKADEMRKKGIIVNLKSLNEEIGN